MEITAKQQKHKEYNQKYYSKPEKTEHYNEYQREYWKKRREIFRKLMEVLKGNEGK